MHCDQIRPHLEQYRDGQLAHFRIAWIAQHIAGCASCAAALGALGTPSAAAPGRPSAPADGESGFASVPERRSIPAWYWPVCVACVLSLVGGVVWNLWYRAPGQIPSAKLPRYEGARELLPEAIQVGAGEVRWVLESLQATGATARLLYRIEGPPGHYMVPSAPVIREQGQALPLLEDRVFVAPTGLRGELVFDLPGAPTGMLVSLPGLLRSEGDHAAIALDRWTRWDDPRGLQFEVLALGSVARGYQIRLSVQGEARWQVVPDLGAVLLDRGFRHQALSWIREDDGKVLRLWFGSPPSDFSPRILMLPLAERIDGPWTAWILLSDES